MTRWRAIPGWEGLYEASTDGDIRSITRTVTKKDGTQQVYKGKLLKGRASPRGHLSVQLSANSRPVGMCIHRLIMLTFVGPCPEGMEVCHNDGNPANNRLENLRYDTHSSNAYDSVTHGVHPHARKTHCKRGHEFNAPNTIATKWRDSTHRRCRACTAVTQSHRDVPADSSEFQTLADHYYQTIQKGTAHV